MTRRGLTLVELMVATTMTLIIMGVVAQLFGILANGVIGSRSTLDMSSHVRAVANTLRNDLAGATALTTPPLSSNSDAGYLEIIEGPLTDDPGAARNVCLTGDCDDILMLTTQSLSSAFVGRLNGSSSIESPYAEVIWFCKPSGAIDANSPLYTLYRRQLLVMDYVGAGNFSAANAIPGTIADAHVLNDISLRIRTSSPSLFLAPNSLADLVKPENRFLHNPDAAGVISSANFPYRIAANPVPQVRSNGPLTGARLGEDIILTNVLSFDVRVFDPTAPIRVSNGIAVTPGDPGFATGGATPATGAYVDLGWGATGLVNVGAAFPPASQSYFQSSGMRVSNAPRAASIPFPTYDTGSVHYEFNGIDEDNDGLTDEGTDGIDNDLNGVADDPGEMETSVPYPTALRGLEVRIRCYEPASRQIRQMTVRHSFVPL